MSEGAKTDPTRDVVVLATQNAKKGKELQELAAGRFRVRTLADLGLAPEILEDKDTFEGNAITKAEGVAAALAEAGLLDGIWAVLADDSGIVVDALSGAPGVRSARFAADHRAGEGDEANNRLLLAKLGGVPAERRSARFACAICVLVLGQPPRTTYATVEGRIAEAARGTGGFGYDPLFLPDAFPGRHMAELSASEKHAISHRGQAMRTALAWLER